MPVKTYDPKQVVLSIGGVSMGGYADGTFINITSLNDAYATKAGADGEIARAKSNDNRGELVLTLLQTSLSNDILSAIYTLDQVSNEGVVPILLKDLSGLTTYFSGAGWIRKLPDASFEKEISNREWTFDLADMNAFVGGVTT